jgi:hypothetical protein
MRADWSEMKAKKTERSSRIRIDRMRVIKIGASALIVFPLLAVFWAPFRFATFSPETGGSPFANYPDLLFEIYYQPLYLDHGYSFFAPNPGPTHVVDYRVFNESGDVIEEGRFPDRSEHLPRLRYHRYFMLGENLNGLWTPADELPPEAPVDVRRQHDRRRSMYLSLKSAIEEGLARKHGGSHAVVYRVQHRSPTFQEFMEEKWTLTDPRLFETLSETLPKAASMPEDLRK